MCRVHVGLDRTCLDDLRGDALGAEPSRQTAIEGGQRRLGRGVDAECAEGEAIGEVASDCHDAATFLQVGERRLCGNDRTAYIDV